MPYQRHPAGNSLMDGEHTAWVVLLIEDDYGVRQVLRETLERSGYSVYEACDGVDGINMYKEHGDSIHLVLSDVMMPRKNGREVYDEIRRLKEDVKVLFMSGYSADIMDNQMIRERGLNFMTKPIRPQELLVRIREILDA